MPKYGLPNKKVKEVMSKDIEVVNREDTIESVVERFVETGYHGFPVVYGSELVGIITKLDLLKILERKGIKDVFATHVKDLMTQKPLKVDKDTHLVKAAKIMINNEISLLPVVDDGENIVGVISKTDLVNEIEKNHES